MNRWNDEEYMQISGNIFSALDFLRFCSDLLHDDLWKNRPVWRLQSARYSIAAPSDFCLRLLFLKASRPGLQLWETALLEADKKWQQLPANGCCSGVCAVKSERRWLSSTCEQTDKNKLIDLHWWSKGHSIQEWKSHEVDVVFFAEILQIRCSLSN